MPVLTCARTFLTLQPKRLPLLVGAEAKARSKDRSPFPRRTRRGGVWERQFVFTLARQTQRWEIGSTQLSPSVSSALRGLRSNQSPKMPTMGPGNSREWEQSLPFSSKPATLPGTTAGARGPPAPHQPDTGEPCQAEKERDGSSGHYRAAAKKCSENGQLISAVKTDTRGAQLDFKHFFFPLPANPRLCRW